MSGRQTVSAFAKDESALKEEEKRKAKMRHKQAADQRQRVEKEMQKEMALIEEMERRLKKNKHPEQEDEHHCDVVPQTHSPGSDAKGIAFKEDEDEAEEDFYGETPTFHQKLPEIGNEDGSEDESSEDGDDSDLMTMSEADMRKEMQRIEELEKKLAQKKMAKQLQKSPPGKDHFGVGAVSQVEKGEEKEEGGGNLEGTAAAGGASEGGGFGGASGWGFHGDGDGDDHKEGGGEGDETGAAGADLTSYALSDLGIADGAAGEFSGGGGEFGGGDDEDDEEDYTRDYDIDSDGGGGMRSHIPSKVGGPSKAVAMVEDGNIAAAGDATVGDGDGDGESFFSQEAATAIQAVYRGRMGRQRVQIRRRRHAERVEQQQAAGLIQGAARRRRQQQKEQQRGGDRSEAGTDD